MAEGLPGETVCPVWERPAVDELSSQTDDAPTASDGAASGGTTAATEPPLAPAPSPAVTSRLKPLRHWAALVVVVIAAVGFISLRATDSWRSCTTEVTRTSDTPPYVEHVETCDEVSLTVLIPVLVLLVALMWPDIAEVELFGLGSVKRRLNEQDARQNELEATQQRLENRLIAQVQQNAVVHQSPVVNIGTDPAAAQLVEGVLDERARAEAARQEAGVPAPSTQEQRQRLDELGAQLAPWLNVARRMNDPAFAAAVRRGAASGSPSDDPELLEPDKELLRRVERPGHPFRADELERWAQENALALDAVRDTLRAGDAASPESVRVAAKAAGQLVSDLERRGLVATA